MKQRVAIARALVESPEFIMMDEPFAALDFQTRVLMQHFLLEVWLEFRPTIIFVTHHIDEAVLLADRVVVMSAGPGRIIDEVRIDLPRPRRMTDPGFNDYRARLTELLEREVMRALCRRTARLDAARVAHGRREAATARGSTSPTCSITSAPLDMRYSATAPRAERPRRWRSRAFCRARMVRIRRCRWSTSRGSVPIARRFRQQSLRCRACARRCRRATARCASPAASTTACASWMAWHRCCVLRKGE